MAPASGTATSVVGAAVGVAAARRSRRRAPSASPPRGVTTRVDVPADSTEEEYFQACHAAKEWMDAQPKTGRVAVRAVPGDGSDVAIGHCGQLEQPVGGADPGTAGGRDHRRAGGRQRRMRVASNARRLGRRVIEITGEKNADPGPMRADSAAQNEWVPGEVVAPSISHRLGWRWRSAAAAPAATPTSG